MANFKENYIVTLKTMAGDEIVAKVVEVQDNHGYLVMTSWSRDVYFICGELGEKDQNGLPENILICPAYGVDWFQVYKKTDQSHGPEY